MKPTVFIFILLFAASIYGQGKSTLFGNITATNGEPLSFSSVYIEELKKGTSANGSGHYELQNIPAGSYTITVSEIGHISQQQLVQIKEGEKIQLDFELRENITKLQTVEVTGRKEKSYKNSRSFIGAKTEIALIDLPQAVSYATKELIADQGLMRVGEVVRNFSGVNQNTFYDDIIIRGFRINGSSSTQLLNGLRTSTGFWKQPLANYLERVEVLKGPASALFGNASPGGVLNRVTKKPLDEERHSLSFSTGSYNTIRALADFTGPLSKDKSLLYRLNIGYEDANSYRDLQFDKNIVLAPSVSFLPTDRTRVNFDLIYNSSKSRLDRGQSTNKGDLYATPVSLALSSANDFLNEETYIVTLALNHQFTDQFSFSASYIRTGYSEDLLEHRSANAYAVDGNGDDMEDLVAMQVFQRKRKRYIDNMSAFLNYGAQTGIFGHNLVLGYDYAQEELPPGGSQLQAQGYRNAANDGVINRYDPDNSSAYLLDASGNPVPNIPHFDLNDRIASQQLKDMSKYFYSAREFGPNFYSSHGIYVQDQISWDRLKVLIGLRYDRYGERVDYLTDTETTVDQDAFLPRLGITYSVTDNVNLYGTYVEGYGPQNSANMDPNLGGPFDPLESSMVEFGAKSSWFKGKLDATLALYRITQKNTLYNIPNSDLLQQIGEEESKGVEMDLTGRILPNWSVSMSYAFNESGITKDEDRNASGLQKPNTPKHQGNLWTRYNVTHGVLKNFGIGAGSNFVTERILQIDNSQTIPGYTLLNAALFYKVNKFSLQLNVNNLSNKAHWVGGYDYIRLFPGTPRNWMLTLGYAF
jgi:iron complex outermembrane receptor protein